MATMLGYEGSVLSVAVLLLLALGLAGALYAAIRDDSRRHPDQARRTR